MSTSKVISFSHEIKAIHKDLLKRRACDKNTIEKVIDVFNKRHSSITKTSEILKR